MNFPALDTRTKISDPKTTDCENTRITREDREYRINAGEADRVQPAEESLVAAAACNSRAIPRREQRGVRQQGGHVALQSTRRRDQTRRAGLLLFTFDLFVLYFHFFCYSTSLERFH